MQIKNSKLKRQKISKFKATNTQQTKAKYFEKKDS